MWLNARIELRPFPVSASVCVIKIVCSRSRIGKTLLRHRCPSRGLCHAVRVHFPSTDIFERSTRNRKALKRCAINSGYCRRNHYVANWLSFFLPCQVEHVKGFCPDSLQSFVERDLSDSGTLIERVITYFCNLARNGYFCNVRATVKCGASDSSDITANGKHIDFCSVCRPRLSAYTGIIVHSTATGQRHLRRCSRNLQSPFRATRKGAGQSLVNFKPRSGITRISGNRRKRRCPTIETVTALCRNIRRHRTIRQSFGFQHRRAVAVIIGNRVSAHRGPIRGVQGFVLVDRFQRVAFWRRSTRRSSPAIVRITVLCGAWLCRSAENISAIIADGNGFNSNVCPVLVLESDVSHIARAATTAACDCFNSHFRQAGIFRVGYDHDIRFAGCHRLFLQGYALYGDVAL